MKLKSVVLGCGLVGSTMARELARCPDFEVTAVDSSIDNLAKLRGFSGITTLHGDLSDAQGVRRLVSDFDVVLGALPSRIAFAALEGVIRASRPYCDISFMPQDPMTLDGLAKEHGTTVVVDCGVSPGLSNMMVGYAHSQFDRADCAEIYVGGLPKVRRWPFEYKAPFAPPDIIEIYTRPARMVENGRLVVKPALSEPELIDFPGVGTLEAFNTDGLRTLLATVNIPNMKEKTLRYPGHIELMRIFRETGLFDQTPIRINRVNVTPLEVTSKLLFPRWALEEGEEEFTVLRVIVKGLKDGRARRYTYDLYDEYDRDRGETSMARTTGFPCVIVAQMLAQGRIEGPGVLPPELLARRDGVFDYVIAELARRGVAVEARVDEADR